MAAYFRPKTLDEALGILANERAEVLAGGTDVYPARTARIGWGDMRRSAVLDISAVNGLRGITEEGDHYRLGALTTWSDLRCAALPSAFAGYQTAARDVGGAQVQNRGTLVGNICTASPAGDGIPCLMTLDAKVELASLSGFRTLAIEEFLSGYRTTVRRPDELVTALLVPKPSLNARGRFLKLGARRYLVISIVMAAAVLGVDERGVIAAARVAVGACTPVATRLTDMEGALIGLALSEAADAATEERLATLLPIDDIRASAAFRRAAAQRLVRDLLAGFSAERELRAA